MQAGPSSIQSTFPSEKLPLSCNPFICHPLPKVQHSAPSVTVDQICTFIYIFFHSMLSSYQMVFVQSLSLVQLFCDPMDSSPPSSSVHGTFQARILEWLAISFSNQMIGTIHIVANINGSIISMVPYFRLYCKLFIVLLVDILCLTVLCLLQITLFGFFYMPFGVCVPVYMYVYVYLHTHTYITYT